MDWLLPLFPQGGGLGQSVITTVWIGVMVVGILNLRFGFPLTGLVVPGYLTPLVIVNPTSATVILIESILVYGLMRFSAKELMERFGYSELFGRDRFFAIILLSILVRVLMDMLLWPILANELSQWDITFDYASHLYSLGLVIIALTANVMWNGGFRYGLGVTLLQLLITFVIVRFGLMELTNFSIANLSIMYEAVAASIIAAPKAYIILVITAFLASRANIKYGWEFNGIMLPALLALQLMEPWKLLTSFVETGVILLIGGLLLSFTRLKHAQFEGARLLIFFFNIGFIYKLGLNYLVANYFPEFKVTDTFAFGYMLSTLLALKIYQKNALGLIIRATLQTSIIGGAFAIFIGFLFMFIPSLLTTTNSQSSAFNTHAQSLEERVNLYKSQLYTSAQQTDLSLNQFEIERQVDSFKLALGRLKKDLKNDESLDLIAQKLELLSFKLDYDNHFIFISDNITTKPRGLFVIKRSASSPLLLAAPYPTSERIASDGATALFRLLNNQALAFGNQQQTKNSADSHRMSPFYQAFIEVFEQSELMQIREVAQNPNSLTTQEGRYFIYNQLPHSLYQKQLETLLGSMVGEFGLSSSNMLPWRHYQGQFVELFLNTNNYSRLLSQLALIDNNLSVTALAETNAPLEQIVLDFQERITAKGSNQFRLLSYSEAALWENEVISPLLKLHSQLSDANALNTHMPSLMRINAIARTLNYELLIIKSSPTALLGLRPLDTPAAYALGQGLYLFGLGQRSNLSIQVPRPLFESNTLKFASALFEHTEAKTLLIAGAHPFANKDANVMAPDNITSLFNVVHQSTLRAFQATPLLSVQIRSHSAPSEIRPSAIAYLNTEPNPAVQNEVSQLMSSLNYLNVSAQEVVGSRETRGLEIGTSPQSGYQLFSKQTELATLWLASDFKQHFALEDSAQNERLLSTLKQNRIEPTTLKAWQAQEWAVLPEPHILKVKTLLKQFSDYQQVGAVAQLCQSQKQCNTRLLTMQFRGREHSVLVLLLGSKPAMMYFPSLKLTILNKMEFNKYVLEVSDVSP